MEQTTYSRKENGKSPITNEEFEKLAKLLDTDIEAIKREIPSSTKNENCTFNDNSIGINYINIPQELLDTVLKYNRKLEEEVLHLKQQLSK
jgi:transcriptional regulator with XRE-family HTH domain